MENVSPIESIRYEVRSLLNNGKRQKLLWAFPEDVPDEECICKMAANAYETIAYDHAYGKVILFVWP